MSNCLVFERDDDDEGLLVDSERSCGEITKAYGDWT
jgi:hypothetical protein